MKNTPLTPIIQEIVRILGTLCQEPGQGPNIYSLLYYNIILLSLYLFSLTGLLSLNLTAI